MKRATENLINDHFLIEEAMEIMEKMITTEHTQIEDFEFMVNFIRDFADGCHHAKEEGLLFPKLTEKGMPPKQGPIGVMLMEHDKGRSYVKGIAENIALYKNGNAQALQEILSNMQGYISLLRDHIDKENTILFRMADNLLTEEEQVQLISQFNQSEAASEGFRKKQQFIEKLSEFAASYGLIAKSN